MNRISLLRGAALAAVLALPLAPAAYASHDGEGCSNGLCADPNTPSPTGFGGEAWNNVTNQPKAYAWEYQVQPHYAQNGQLVMPRYPQHYPNFAPQPETSTRPY